jgi:predicted CXXCH cytochrome family protein
MLSSQQDPKDLPDWIKLDYFRDPRPLGRWRTRLTRGSWLVGGALCAVLLVLPLTGPRRLRPIYESEPVSTAHLAFNNDCGRCHTESLQTARRLIGGDGVRSVKDAACLHCHEGPPHQATQIQAETPACATCHDEHQGRAELALVVDGQCTRCHADLKTTKGPAAEARRRITAFPGDHPECRLWRDGQPEDRGRLRFNHKVHLTLTGAERKQALPAIAQWLPLECSACHKPDADGRAMQPISYRAHCQNCHPIPAPLKGEWVEPNVREAAERFRRTPAPHPGRRQTAAVVRDALRGRYLDFASDSAVLSGAAEHEPARPLPGSRRAAAVREPVLAWANDQLRDAERVLFDHGGGCALCHVERTHPERRPNALPEYEPTGVPSRWFDDFTRFSHRSHPMLACTACHQGARESERTADVLIPKIESCRDCHSPKGGARHDCAACHRYHEPAKGRGMGGPLKEIGDLNRD